MAAALVLALGVSDAIPPNNRSFIAEQNESHVKVAGWVDEHYPEATIGAVLGHRLAGFFERPVVFLEVASLIRGEEGARALIEERGIDLFLHTGPSAAEWTRPMEDWLRRNGRLVERIGEVRIFELDRGKP